MHPILFKVGGYPVHTFGVMLVIGFFAGIGLAASRGPKFGVSKEAVSDIGIWVVLAGVLGARLLFILQEFPYYSQHIGEMLSIQFQGLTSFGGVLGGILALILSARRRGLKATQLFDIYGPGFLLGHVFGRIGCLMNGCCYGPTCTPGATFCVAVDGLPDLHVPAQLYDSMMTLAGLLLLLYLERRRFKLGQATGASLIVYGVSRFIYEFWRAGVSSTKIAGLPLTEAHIVAILMVVAGFVYWFRATGDPV